MQPDDLDFVRLSIRALHQHLRAELLQRVRRIGLTLPQMRAMREVVAHPGLGIQDLARRAGMTQSTASGIVGRLVAKGLVSKRPHPADRRQVELWPTPAVDRFMASGRSAFLNEPVAAMMRALTPAERATVIEGLRLLVARIPKT